MPRELTPVSKTDWLREDQPIPGQNFVCISYVAPEDFIKKYEVYCFEEFLKRWNFNKSIEVFVTFLNFISYKYKVSVDDLHSDFKEFVESEREKLQDSNISLDLKDYMTTNRDQLLSSFGKIHDFQTSVRGVKVRGVYSTKDDAIEMARKLNENDRSVSVHVADVGKWLALDNVVGKDVKYQESELNTLMEEREKNDIRAKSEFDNRVETAKREAMAENIKKAEKTGNVLTQMIDEHGQLTGVGNITQEQQFGDSDKSVTIDELKEEMFEGDNIVTSLTDHGQSKLKSGPLANKDNTEQSEKDTQSH
ncbi:hypothetical protein OAA60_01885 [Porticoccaceae bacterium]|jgi:hypothetical protein|nr:hypothetical protein [Porticoccaceae bacterium]